MFGSRVINEKRIEKSVDDFSPTPMVMDPEKSIFADDLEFDQIWWTGCQHLVEWVGQNPSVFDRYFSRKTIMKINDNCPLERWHLLGTEIGFSFVLLLPKNNASWRLNQYCLQNLLITNSKSIEALLYLYL